MTDRTTDLKNDYAAMRVDPRVAPLPESHWYLFERAGHDAWIEQYAYDEVDHFVEPWRAKGWTVTIVGVFREGKAG